MIDEKPIKSELNIVKIILEKVENIPELIGNFFDFFKKKPLKKPEEHGSGDPENKWCKDCYK